MTGKGHGEGRSLRLRATRPPSGRPVHRGPRRRALTDRSRSPAPRASRRDGRAPRPGTSIPRELARGGGARVVALQTGRATLEIVNPAHWRLIDELEVGRAVSRSIRVAFEVDVAAAMTQQLVAAGASLVATPKETPWRALNSRLEGPAALQLTLFEEQCPTDWSAIQPTRRRCRFTKVYYDGSISAPRAGVRKRGEPT